VRQYFGHGLLAVGGVPKRRRGHHDRIIGGQNALEEAEQGLERNRPRAGAIFHELAQHCERAAARSRADFECTQRPRHVQARLGTGQETPDLQLYVRTGIDFSKQLEDPAVAVNNGGIALIEGHEPRFERKRVLRSRSRRERGRDLAAQTRYRAAFAK